MPPRDLLDPRWHWLRQALDCLYRELEPDMQRLTLTLATETPAGEQVCYVLHPGAPEIVRILATNKDNIADALIANTVDLTPNATMSE